MLAIGPNVLRNCSLMYYLSHLQMRLQDQLSFHNIYGTNVTLSVMVIHSESYNQYTQI